MKRPTLLDVARLAGVSHMTVSRVARGEHSVSAETARRVRTAIEKTGYLPDPALSALAAYRSNRGGRTQRGVIAFLDCDGSAHSRVMLTGAQSEAAMLGYRVERFGMEDDGAQRKIGRVLFHRGIEGLLFGPADEPRVFDSWKWERFAPVSLGALYHQPAMHAVGMDYFYGLQLAYDALAAQGCERIGLVVEKQLEARTGHLWLGAYAARERRIPALLFSRGGQPAGAVRRWIRANRIDGVLTIHGGLHAEFARAGIRAGYLNDYSAAPEAACVSLDPAQVGAEGIRVLHHLLLRRELGLPLQPKTVLLRGKWTANNS